MNKLKIHKEHKTDLSLWVNWKNEWRMVTHCNIKTNIIRITENINDVTCKNCLKKLHNKSPRKIQH